MIPKIIHCCWFSDEPKTELAERCLASWRKFAPDCEIREWTLADIPNAPEFVREAVRRRKWAFAADWLRFWALHLEGGVYFDLDFELVAPFTPEVEFVAGQRLANGQVGMEPAILSLEKGSPIAAAMLAHYASADFSVQVTVGEIMEGIRDRGLGIRVLEPEVMSPIGVDGKMHRTERTVGIHWYAMSWASPKQKVLQWMSWHGMRPLIDAFLVLRNRVREFRS